MGKDHNRGLRIPWLHFLFFCSGIPALIYQIVWQRALFAIYGLNIQSVTIVVSGFMLGLGLGSLVGGRLSNSKRFAPIVLFATAELLTGIFGAVSLKTFHRVAEITAGSSQLATAFISFFVIVLSTLLMGATLPLLVEYLVRSTQNVGSSVGSLYFANNLGAGLACFLAAAWLMRDLGQRGSLRVAALVNVLVAIGALTYDLFWRQSRKEILKSPPDLMSTGSGSVLPYSLAIIGVAFSGFAALSYEIIWYRLLSFASHDTAPAFASLLGAYLFGLALGSRSIDRYSRNHSRENALRALSAVIFASAMVAFAVAPLSALVLNFASPDNLRGSLPGFSATLLLICAGASLFGATFPLIAYVSVNPKERAGASLSYLYAANIVGSTLGTVVVGYTLMDYFSVYQISILLLVAGTLLAAALFRILEPPLIRLKSRFTFAAIAMVLTIVAGRPLYRTLYDRLLFKNRFPGGHFQEVIENRNGAVGVTPNGIVFGGGVYDGRFNVDLLHDTNIIVRPYALGAFHAAPRTVLMIGLGSGSWAQVVANHPQIEDLTIVEINPGYLKLIPEHSVVATLLRNPKVHIVIDDGRRWLLWNPQARFDAIVMNTTFHWRNHASNVLSVEFLQIARKHLKSGGVLFYNTTSSDDVIATALSVYPYAYRFVRCVAVSDSPLVFDRVRWRTVLLNYVIDGKHVVDASDPGQLKQLDEIVSIPLDPTGHKSNSIENNDQLRSRLQNRLIITDDNMGLEWR